MGLAELLKEMCIKDVRMILRRVSRTWKGMILHRSRGNVKRLTTNQRRVQGEVRPLEIDTQHLAHEANIADMSTHAARGRNDTETSSTPNLGYRKGRKVFEDNLGTRSSSKRFEDQVAVGGGKWQGHGGDDAE